MGSSFSDYIPLVVLAGHLAHLFTPYVGVLAIATVLALHVIALIFGEAPTMIIAALDILKCLT